MNDTWSTEQALFNKLNKEFEFVVDLAAQTNNRKVKQYISPEQDFFKASPLDFKNGWCWLNPPYSRGNISQFMRQVEHWTTGHGIKIVALVRFDPSASWFKHYVDGVACEVRMLKHRVKFQGATSAYNFPCCVAIFDRDECMSSTVYSLWSWRE